ncbi:hypothetical protein ACRALDRAFT_2038277 [Sodiomyces alcalophilus JCM 7366]|uniref:uncharacterized protein n=1 Tax=Sodiomyces alcalophilus JCM 7366 TaxID=591952 RepID=UPI0039B548E5
MASDPVARQDSSTPSDANSRDENDGIPAQAVPSGNAPQLDPPAAHPRRYENPLTGIAPVVLEMMATAFCTENGITSDEDERAFRLGVALAQDPDSVHTLAGLTDEEKRCIGMESQGSIIQKLFRSVPSELLFVVAVCSLCAAVQGMDETTVNGAQIFYKTYFGIDENPMILGLVNGAPYLCCAVLGCWLTGPLNAMYGRRGTIMFCCGISALACLLQANAGGWWDMFISRLLLGLGIGPKSATVPMYAAECAPPKLRGALVMQWQMWTAFGMMIGFSMTFGLYTMIVCGLCHLCPESPQYLLQRKKYLDAYKSMCKLRLQKVQAARDIIYAHALLQRGQEVQQNQPARAQTSKVPLVRKLSALFGRRRNRNAFWASQIVMFMQQFCGVNIIAYYSAEIFVQEGFSHKAALGVSLGWGVLNFLGAIPAIWAIDRWGRRALLLLTFPLLAICMSLSGWAFSIDDMDSRITAVTIGTYLFCLFYSSGAGPVPFTYSAEVYPLDLRTFGMSIATATTWTFNFILAFTFPMLLRAFTTQGAFGFYAAWNVVGFFLTLFFVPETKRRTLEELDGVFNVTVPELCRFGLYEFQYYFRRYILCQRINPPRQPFRREYPDARPDAEQGAV